MLYDNKIVFLGCIQKYWTWQYLKNMYRQKDLAIHTFSNFTYPNLNLLGWFVLEECKFPCTLYPRVTTFSLPCRLAYIVKSLGSIQANKVEAINVCFTLSHFFQLAGTYFFVTALWFAFQLHLHHSSALKHPDHHHDSWLWSGVSLWHSQSDCQW